MSLDYQAVTSWEQELALKLNQAANPGWKVFCPQETSSTMDFIKQVYLERIHQGPILVLAQKQNNGRGRQGRKWLSTEGSLTASLGFKIKPQDLSSFSLVVALALNKALAQFSCPTKIKWPNDLLTSDGRKIAGILIERYEDFLSVGIGINIKSHTYENFSALEDFTKERPAITEIAYVFSTLIYFYYNIFEQHGFKAFLSQYQDLSIKIDSLISVNTAKGLIQGVYKGVDEQGALRVLVDNNLKVLNSAEISCLEENVCC